MGLFRRLVGGEEAVKALHLPFQRRAAEWDTTGLPVPADLLVYTRDEWQALAGRFRDTLEREAVWVYPWG